MNGRALRWLLSLLRSSRPDGETPRLTILRHHRVYRDGERPLYRLGVSESVLRQQVALLLGLGLGPCTVVEGLEHLAGSDAGHRVAMTFDDGYADNVERALPILAGAGGRATFYLTAGLIDERVAPWWDVVVHALEGSPRSEIDWTCEGERIHGPLRDPSARRAVLGRVLRHLRVDPARQRQRIAELRASLEVKDEAPCPLATWSQARALAEAGMEVGAHTMTHPYLDRLDAPAQEAEIAGSVRTIEARLAIRPVGLAYPGGAFDAASVRASEASGLRYAVTTRAGSNHPRTPRFELLRRGFDEGMCLGPGGRFSRRLARAELEGAFDGLRGVGHEAVA